MTSDLPRSPMTSRDNDDILKLDLHVHSYYSEDAHGSPQEIIKHAQKQGLHGVSITDHNSVDGSLQALKIKPKEFLVIPGVEISTADGHFIALGLKENVPRGLSVEETVDYIRDKGGVPVTPHLFRRMSGIKKKKLRGIKNDIPAMEVFNGCSLPKTNDQTARVAQEFNLGGIGGSDSHQPEFVGYGYTTIPSGDFTVDGMLSAIEKKQTWGEGTTIPFKVRKNRMIKSIKQFFHRGFKKI